MLPKVQVEIGYDLFCNADGKEAPIDVSLNLYEQGKSKSSWNFVKKFSNENEADSYSNTKFRIVNNERFRTHRFIADLSTWAGKYIRLSFEADFSKTSNGFYQMRWTEGRIVSSDFYIKVQKDDSVLVNKSYLKNSDSLYIYTDTSYPINIMNNPSFIQYPDIGITIERFRGRDIACLTGALQGIAHTFLIDLGSLSYPWDIVSIPKIESSLVRDGVSGPLPSDYTYGSLHPVLSPIQDPYYELDNFYAGIGSIIEFQNTGTENSALHAFFHAEDIYYNGINQGNSNRYLRIGYARSNISGSPQDAYTFTRYNTQGQPNSQIITSPYSESSVRGPSMGHRGTGSPSVIKYNSYYYLYYQGVENNWGDSNDGICIARCPVSTIDQSTQTYQNTPNGWMKYYNGHWNEPGIGGNASRILHLRSGAKISYNNVLNKFMMVADWTEGIYIHTSMYPEGPWDAGILILQRPIGLGVEDVFSYSSLTNTSERLSSMHNRLYYASEQSDPNTPYYYWHKLWRCSVVISNLPL